MSTTVVEKPTRTDSLPEWRRLCHYYPGGGLRSACGTARRPPWEWHYEDECAGEVDADRPAFESDQVLGGPGRSEVRFTERSEP